MSKIIVTGGAGFIGSNLTDQLVELGHEVYVIDNLSGGKKEQINPKAIFHQVDIVDIENIRPIFAGVDFVFHLAALPSVQLSIENPLVSNKVNVEGTLNVLLCAKDSGVKKIIYSASGAAYGDQSVIPIVETMLANPISPYGLQKYVGEMYCKVFGLVYGLPTVCLRYFNVYGPRQNAVDAYASVIAKFVKQKREGKSMTITGDGEQARDFVSVHDVVRANILAMEKEVGGGEVFNIGTGQNFSINTVSEMIGGSVEYIEARLEPKDTCADNNKAREMLGWVPKVKLEEGIKELLD